MKLDIEAMSRTCGATLKLYGTLPNGSNRLDWVEFSKEELEAFARLIVERCAERCEEEDVAPTDDPIGVQECIATSIRNLLED